MFLSPLDLLEQCNRICSRTKKAERSFVRHQSTKIAEKVEKATSHLPGIVTVKGAEFPRHPLTATELHRIRRVLWRLSLYFETCRWPGKSKGCYGIPHELDWLIKAYCEMYKWEIEEFECMYHYLKYHSQLWRVQCTACGLKVLPDEQISNGERCSDVYMDDDTKSLLRTSAAREESKHNSTEAQTESPNCPDFAAGAGFPLVGWSLVEEVLGI